MKPGALVAAGMGVGYLLGRTRKMRLALMAAAAVTGVAGSPRELVRRGLKQLGSSPQLGELTEAARGQLLDAAKTAAVTAASNRIDALNERLQGTAGTSKATDEEPPEQEPAEESEETEHDGAEAKRRRRRAASGTTTRRRAGAETSESPRRSGTRTRATNRTPVRRTRG